MEIEGAAEEGAPEKKKGGGLAQVEEMVATWKGLGEEEKAPWNEKAAELKAAYHTELVSVGPGRGKAYAECWF